MSKQRWIQTGAMCWAKIQGKNYAAIIEDWSDTREGDYLLTKIRYAYPAPLYGTDAVKIIQHPKPIQSYHLSRRVVSVKGLDDATAEP